MSEHWIFGWDELFGLFTTIAVGAGAVAAWVGLKTWREEHIERRQCEMAEEALSLMYEASDVFDMIRSPLSLGREGSSRSRDDNETKEQREQRDVAYVPIERINDQQEFFGRVVSLRPKLRAVFGRESDQPLTEMLRIRNEIITAVKMLSTLDRKNIPKNKEAAERHMAQIRKFESIKWSYSDDGDEIKNRIAQATETIEALANPLLQSRYRSN